MIRTSRLLLRPLAPEDAPALAAVAGERRIADTTISVPHPFGLAEAQRWIDACLKDSADGHRLGLAILPKDSDEFAGYIGLHHIDPEHGEAEISFWTGSAHQGRGYVGEAGAAIIDHGFETLGLNRICAFHMVRNPASERVLTRLGFQREGLLRQRVCKWGVYEDVAVWSRLRSDPRP